MNTVRVNVKKILQSSCVAALVGGLGSIGAHADEHGRSQVLHLPNPYGEAVLDHANPHRNNGGGGSGISYHGGPVMLGTVHAYAIWYGAWTQNGADLPAKTIITDFLHSVGGSPYYNMNTTYYNGSGTRVSNAVQFSGSASDNYSQGANNLSDSAIAAIVSRAISTGALPSDPNGVYFVLTSADVTKSGFCTSYCGWHTDGFLNGTDIKYSFIGNPVACPKVGASVGNCAAQPSVSPNGDVGADGMVSIIAHELEEAASDPDGNAWYDSAGYENADKCAWTFGSTYGVSNGSKANMSLPSPTQQASGNTTTVRNYLIQRNWVNSGGGYCALAY